MSSPLESCGSVATLIVLAYFLVGWTLVLVGLDRSSDR